MKFSTVACRTTRIDMATVSRIDHFRTRRRRSPSRPWRPAALVPTARFCGEITLPRTPPPDAARRARREGGGGGAAGEGVRRERLPEGAARGVRGDGEVRAHPDLLRRHLLQV